MAKLMRDSFSYPIQSTYESNYLIEALDDALYATLGVIDKLSNTVQKKYVALVSNYAFHTVDGRSSYSSTGSDSILLSSLFWCRGNVNWLDTVRRRVKLFRLYWMDYLHELDNSWCREYLELSNKDGTNERQAELEKEQGLPPGTGYGVAMEVRSCISRIEKIVRKLTYPYLRKVVVHANHFSAESNPSMFMENYQNGSSGIRIAIGRHDITLGAFASTVDRWISNRIMTFIRDNGMLVKVPDRAFTHKNIVDKHLSRNPQMSLDEIAETEGISHKLLVESMNMVQSQTGYVDLEEEDESTSRHSDSYIDRATDPDNQAHVQATTVNEYSTLLKPRERVLLSIAYGVEDSYVVNSLDAQSRTIERTRQLLAVRHISRRNMR